MNRPLNHEELVNKLLAAARPTLSENRAYFSPPTGHGSRWLDFPVFCYNVNGEAVNCVHEDTRGLTFEEYGKPGKYQDIPAQAAAGGTLRDDYTIRPDQLAANLVRRQLGALLPTEVLYNPGDRIPEGVTDDGTRVYAVTCQLCGVRLRWSQKQLLEGFARFKEKLTHGGCRGHK